MATATANATFIPGADLVVGDIIDFFGDLHTIDHFETNAGPLVDAELVLPQRYAVDATGWRMTIPACRVPCLRGVAL
jgi:hypothetical protein